MTDHNTDFTPELGIFKSGDLVGVITVAGLPTVGFQRESRPRSWFRRSAASHGIWVFVGGKCLGIARLKWKMEKSNAFPKIHCHPETPPNDQTVSCNAFAASR